MTSSNRKFSALLAICAGNSPVTGEFPTQRPVTQSFDVLLDLHLNKRLSKQSCGWWFEMPSHPLWRHRNGLYFMSSKPDLCSMQVNTMLYQIVYYTVQYYNGNWLCCLNLQQRYHWSSSLQAPCAPTPSTRLISFCTTRQIWGIWKLRPAYSPETPNLGQNRWCFVPCDL